MAKTEKQLFPRGFVWYLLTVITQEFFPQEAGDGGGEDQFYDYYGRIKNAGDLVTLDELYEYWRLEIEPKNKEDEKRSK
jgi:hypothetical protein